MKMTIYYISESVEKDNNYYTDYVDEVREEFGYFTDKDEAQAFIDRLRVKAVDKAYDAYVAKIERRNKDERAAYLTAKREYDYLVAGGFKSKAPALPNFPQVQAKEDWTKRCATTEDLTVAELDPHTYDGVG